MKKIYLIGVKFVDENGQIQKITEIAWGYFTDITAAQKLVDRENEKNKDLPEDDGETYFVRVCSPAKPL